MARSPSSDDGNAAARPGWRTVLLWAGLAVGLTVIVLVSGAVDRRATAQDKSGASPAPTSPGAALNRAQRELADAEREVDRADQELTGSMEELSRTEKAFEEEKKGTGTLSGFGALGFMFEIERLKKDIARLSDRTAAGLDALQAARVAVDAVRGALGLPGRIQAGVFQGRTLEEAASNAIWRLEDYQAKAKALSETPCPRDAAGWEQYLGEVANLLACLVAVSSLDADLRAKAEAQGNQLLPLTRNNLLDGVVLKARDALRQQHAVELARYAKAVGTPEERQKLLDQVVAAVNACWDTATAFGGTPPGDYLTKERILGLVTGEYGKKRVEMEWVGLPVEVRVATAPCETCKMGTAPADPPKAGASPSSPPGGAPPK